MQSLALDAFKDWIAATHMIQLVNTTDLERATLNFSAEDLATHGEALKQMLDDATASKADVLRRSSTGELVKAANAFRAVMEPQQGLWEQVEVNGAAKTVSVDASYTNDDDHFVVDLNGTPVRVRGIRYRGTLRRTETALPVASAREYKDGEKRTISQSVTYEPMSVGDVKVGVEFHRMPDLEEAFVVLRTVKEG